VNKAGKHSYGQILKSSALTGGSSAMIVVLGIIRTKALALILGPAGVGLLGIYNMLMDLTRSLAGLGINTSGVRQIAESVGSGDAERIARTVITLRRVAFYSGALGALLLVILAKPVSWITFNDFDHAGAVALLAVAVFFGDVSGGQTALVQGMRRISDLAKMNILGALYGTLFSIPIVYFFKEEGIVPFLICVAGMSILTSWWYARKIKVQPVPVSAREVIDESRMLLKLGVIFMASGLMTQGSGYLARVIILRSFGLDAAGYYTAAWYLGQYYVAFILQAMGADFYPRLTAVANDHSECNRLVNEQAEISLLLAGPGVMATLTFAPLVIDLFYSQKFGPSVELLRWICLGMSLRVASWPMGFILLAKAARKLFFWSELFTNLLFLGLVWAGVKFFGLTGAGIAFFVMYVAYWLGIYFVVRRLTGFRWSPANRRLALLFVPLVAVTFVAWNVLHPAAPLAAAALCIAITIFAAVYSTRTLCTLIPLERLPRAVQKVLRLFRLTPAVDGSGS
jgi:PST family polysaccharide transporter